MNKDFNEICKIFLLTLLLPIFIERASYNVSILVFVGKIFCTSLHSQSKYHFFIILGANNKMDICKDYQKIKISFKVSTYPHHVCFITNFHCFTRFSSHFQIFMIHTIPIIYASNISNKLLSFQHMHNILR